MPRFFQESEKKKIQNSTHNFRETIVWNGGNRTKATISPCVVSVKRMREAKKAMGRDEKSTGFTNLTS